jgi:glutamate formiminotransferase/formiminotetrahydrofolate cyclodeaminase
MNLTNFAKTPIYRVQEMVRREAAHYGLAITKAELIGMTPQKALIDSAKYYLQLSDMKDGQILEHRLQEAQDEERELTPYEFVEATAAATPTPGGGSVAALAGALAAALTQMVAGLTAGRKKYADVNSQADEILQRANELRESLTRAIAEDAAAFDAVMVAYRNKKLTDKQKALAIEEATIEAAMVPLRVAQLSLQVAQFADVMARQGNVNAVTDAAAGAIMAQAAVQAASLNVRINATGIHDRELATVLQNKVAIMESEVGEMAANTRAIAAERGGF